MCSNIQIIEKPDWVSWDEIHNVLLKAHQENITRGMTMRTVSMKGDELRERVGDGLCFVAMDGDKNVVATGSVIVKKVKTWFCDGLAGKLMLGAALPESQGCGLYHKILECRIQYAQQQGAEIVIMDTAEQNLKMQSILKRKGFRYVSCFASPYSKHYSVIMAKWLKGCPYSELYCKFQFGIRKWLTKLRYKPGHIKRFGV